MQLVKRSQWGAPANSPAAPITQARGVKIHYLGATYDSRPHTQCAAEVLKVYRDHLKRVDNGDRWVDIGYNYLVCEHGYVFEGRGLRRLTAANGAGLNRGHYAVCGMLGSRGTRVTPTDAMLNGIVDAIELLRKEGGAGNELLGHLDGYSTACPGPHLLRWVRAGARRPGTGSNVAATETAAPVATSSPPKIGFLAHIPPQEFEGKFGPNPEPAVIELRTQGHLPSSDRPRPPKVSSTFATSLVGPGVGRVQPYRITSWSGQTNRSGVRGNHRVRSFRDMTPHWNGTGGYVLHRRSDEFAVGWASVMRRNPNIYVFDIDIYREGQNERTANNQIVRAAAAGVVKRAGGRLGEVAILTPAGHLVRMLHNINIKVRPDQRIRFGEEIGNLGSAGVAGGVLTNAHIHLEAPRDICRAYIEAMLSGDFTGSG